MTTSSECSRLRMSLGVYVLGAIDPAERAEVDRHLRVCERCRDELASLAGLPAMLSRVSEDQLARLAPPPEELFDSMLAKAKRESRGRRRRSVAWHLAAAVALVVATGAGMGLVTRDDGRPAPRPSATASQAGRTLVGEDPVTGMRAQVSLLPKRWGTALDLRLRGEPRGAHCQMIVVDKNGRRDIAGAWVAPYLAPWEGPYVEYFGSSMISTDQVASVEVRTVDGRRLLRVPV